MAGKIDMVVPVRNEEESIEQNVTRLYRFLSKNLTLDWQIVIVDNGSKDKTKQIADSLERELDNITVLKIGTRGKGYAIREAWMQSESDYMAFTDLDLSTGLEHLTQMIGAIDQGYDIAIGSRLMRSSRVTRCFKREVLSRGYNLMLDVLFRKGWKDTNCGFKLINQRVKKELLQDLQHFDYFFDANLLIQAERRGFKIYELPVTWVEGAKSNVRIARDVPKYAYKAIKYKINPEFTESDHRLFYEQISEVQ